MGKDWNLAQASYADSLRRFRKHGLAVYGTFVFGYDEDDWDVVQRERRVRPRAKAVPRRVQSSGPVPRHAAVSPAAIARPAAHPTVVARPGRAASATSTFRPKRISAADLESACLWARRQFYSWPSICERLWDRRANASSLAMLGVFLGLNLSSHFDIDLRQGLQLGVGPDDEQQRDEPIHVQPCHAGR